MLIELSNQFADAIDATKQSVVQVSSGPRPVSGVIYGPGIIVTTMRPVHGDERIRVRHHDADPLDAELAGWDPATGLAILRTPEHGGQTLKTGDAAVRVGHLVLGVGRSWSGAITASAGIIAIIGGPLQTGRRKTIDVVFRTTAPMHEGFTGGALLDAAGGLIGLVSATAIRGLRVIIPVSIAWKTAATVLEYGFVKWGFLGIAGQPVELPPHQHARDRGVLIVAVTPSGPSAQAGVLVGDILLACNDADVTSPDELIDLLQSTPAGQHVKLSLLRAGGAVEVDVIAGERPLT